MDGVHIDIWITLSNRPYGPVQKKRDRIHAGTNPWRPAVVARV